MALLDDKPKKCCGMVQADTAFFRYRPCSRKATVYDEDNDKWYCGTHSPAAKDAREKKRHERIDKEMLQARIQMEQKERMRQRAAAYPSVKAQRDELAVMLTAVLSQIPERMLAHMTERDAAEKLLKAVSRAQKIEPRVEPK